MSLSLQLRETRYTVAVVTAVFDNLSPDSAPIRTRVGADGSDAYSLLSKIGRGLRLGPAVLPDGDAVESAGDLDAVALDEAAIKAILPDLAHAPLRIDDEDAFRITIAGAQEKSRCFVTVIRKALAQVHATAKQVRGRLEAVLPGCFPQPLHASVQQPSRVNWSGSGRRGFSVACQSIGTSGATEASTSVTKVLVTASRYTFILSSRRTALASGDEIDPDRLPVTLQLPHSRDPN